MNEQQEKVYDLKTIPFPPRKQNLKERMEAMTFNGVPPKIFMRHGMEVLEIVLSMAQFVVAKEGEPIPPVPSVGRQLIWEPPITSNLTIGPNPCVHHTCYDCTDPGAIRISERRVQEKFDELYNPENGTLRRKEVPV